MTPALLTLFALASGGAAPAQRVYTPEGWFEVGAGSNEPELAVVVVENLPSAESVVVPQPAPAPRPAPPAAGPPSREEIERFLRVDCVEVRGRYLQRVLELHGLNIFVLEPRLLEVWTHRRPPTEVGPFSFSEGLGDPALSVLYGEPPVPAGSLSSDFTLQSLALSILECDAQALPPPPGRRPVQRPEASRGEREGSGDELPRVL